MELLIFTGISLGFTLIPGPNAMLIIGAGVFHGVRRGLQVAAGVSAAVAVHLLIAYFGLRSIMQLTGKDLSWVKWLGFAVLGLIALRGLLRMRSPQKAQRPTGGASFRRGFLLSLSNPKSFIFFSAVLIPFAASSPSFQGKPGLLAIIFWLVVTFCDINFALFAAKLSHLLQDFPLPRWLKKAKQAGKPSPNDSP